MKIRFPSFRPDSSFVPRTKIDQDRYSFFWRAVTIVLCVVIEFGMILGILDLPFAVKAPLRELEFSVFFFGVILIIIIVTPILLTFVALSSFIANPIWFGLFNFFKRRNWGDRKAAVAAAWPTVIAANITCFAIFWLLEAVGSQHVYTELGQSLVKFSLPLSLIAAPFAAIGSFR